MSGINKRVSSGDEEEETWFVDRRSFGVTTRPHSAAGGRKVRPLSLTHSRGIISNPKLVKSLHELNHLHHDTSSRSYVSIPRIFDDDDDNLPDDANKHVHAHEEKVPRRRYLGIVLSLFASVVLSLSSIVVKSVSEEYSALSISVWTFQGIFLPSVALAVFHHLNNDDNRRSSVLLNISAKKATALLVRALLGAGGTVLKVYSLQFMSAADSAVITFSTPVFVVFVAWLFLGEPCGIVPILTAILVLLGVTLIIRPPWISGETHFDHDLLVGSSLAFGCTLLGAFAVVTLRYLKDVHYAVVTSVYGLLGTVASLILCYCIDGQFQGPQSFLHWLYAFAIAVLTLIGHTSLTIALKVEEAGPVALLRTSEIIFMFVWQIILLNTLPTLTGVMGAVIVVFGVVIITLRKWVSTLHHSKKSSLCSRILLA